MSKYIEQYGSALPNKPGLSLEQYQRLGEVINFRFVNRLFSEDPRTNLIIYQRKLSALEANTSFGILMSHPLTENARARAVFFREAVLRQRK